MANRNTAIRGVQIRDGEITGDQLATAVNASLALADSAVQPGDLPSFGDIVTHDVDEFATSAQGALADSAVQPGDLPSFGDIVTHDVSEFATSAQGALADTALQAVADEVGAYAGNGLKVVRVNTGGTALEYATLSDAVGILESAVAVEDLTGNADTSLVLADSPVANSVQLYINGLLQEEGSGKDYTIADDTITLAVATEADDIIIVHYIVAV
jgi:hypothetical protein